MSESRGERIRHRLLRHLRARHMAVAAEPLIIAKRSGSLLLVFDSFNRQDAVGLGTTDTGQAWTEVGNAALAIGIVSSKAQGDGGAGDEGAWVEAGRADLAVEGEAVCSEPGISYLMLRYVDVNNFFIGGADNAGNEFAIYRRLASAWTRLGGWVSDPGIAAHQLKFEASGSTLTLYVDGVDRVSVTDTNNQTATKVGIWLRATSNIDSFEVRAL